MKKCILLVVAALSCAVTVPAIARSEKPQISKAVVATQSSAATTPRVQRVQYAGVYHSINNFGIWFWSANSAQHAVAICQANTPAGNVCWYKGFW